MRIWGGALHVKRKKRREGRIKVDFRGQKIQMRSGEVEEVAEQIQTFYETEEPPEIWRSISKLRDDDWVESEEVKAVLTEDREEWICRVRLGTEDVLEVLAQTPGELCQQLERDLALKEIYLVDEVGEEINYETELSGREFMICIHQNRMRWLRARWPGGDQPRPIKRGKW
jgi:hypothetical protein